MPASRAKKYMRVASQQIYHSKVHVDSTLQVCDSAVKKKKIQKKINALFAELCDNSPLRFFTRLLPVSVELDKYLQLSKRGELGL